MSDKNSKKKDECIQIDADKLIATKLPANTKENNPFKHLRAIPIGPLHTATTAANPFLASIVNKDKKSLKQDNEPEKPAE